MQAEEIKELRGRIEFGETIYWCPGCESEIEEPCEVRECPHCEETFDGTSEGRNCPECNRPFTRKVTEKGCPECVDETEVELLSLKNFEDVMQGVVRPESPEKKEESKLRKPLDANLIQRITRIIITEEAIAKA